MKETKLRGVYEEKGSFHTISANPGKTYFEQEQTFRIGGKEYRNFDPRHSKLAAALAKGCQQFNINEDSIVLYLGASHGYTVSFLSDILKEGFIFAVDIAPEVMRDLIFIAEDRNNIAPILANASLPDEFAHRVAGADIVFQDIAQRDQLEIFFKNCERFLVKGGTGMLAVKARSMDVRRKPQDIFKEVKREIEASQYTLIDYRELDPLEKDHAFFVVKRK